MPTPLYWLFRLVALTAFTDFAIPFPTGNR